MSELRPSPYPERVVTPTPHNHGILVVDDTAGVRGVVAIAMRRQGFNVWLASDGNEALEVYQAYWAFIDVVLLDVRMPGLDGPQTLAVLRRIFPHVRCCFMTGDLGEYTEADLLNLGALAVFQKPLRVTELARQIQELAGAPTGRTEAARGDNTTAADFVPFHCRPGVEL